VFVITDPVVTVKPPAVLASVPAVMETSPPVDSIRAARVALALPLIVTFPLATIGPVGLTVVPPEILMVPEDAVSEPAPAYEVFGATTISVPDTDEPTLTEVVVEVIETRLVDEVTAAEVVSSVFALRVTEVDAEIAPDMFTVVPVDTTETDPAVEVRGAVELEIAADPESDMFPFALTAPVGPTEVPPLIVTAPAEVKVPEPVYAPEGVITMLPELVVVWLPFIAMAPPITVRFPATEFVPETVTPLVFPVFPIVKPPLPTKDQVELKVWSELKILAAG
jgi:hypothetical protein